MSRGRAARGGRIGLFTALALGASGCGGSEPADTDGSSTSSSSSSSSTGEPATESTAGPSTGEPTTGGTATGTSADPTTSTSDATSTGTSSSSTGDDSTTGAVGCTKNVVLMGYWPPTNEMLRPWSTNTEQNPDGWIGQNWGGYGYDVYSFFPEFPPDGDPNNDKIGEDGAVGSPDFDLRVDYQATSSDFWRIVDMYQPNIMITTSRGGDIGWEVEALEGGHGMNNNGGPAMDWASDQHGMDQFPTQETIEARSWDVISTYRKGMTLPSTLPMDLIVEATSSLGLTSVEINQETSGNFLSGFLGLHGVYYHSITPHNVAAGHIHVGFGLPVEDASMLIDATLHAVLEQFPVDSVDCPP